MFNFFFSSDIHFDFFKPFSTFNPDGTSSRLQIIKKVLLDGIKKSDCDTIILCGDILNVSKSITPLLANFVKQFFEEIGDREIIVFDGNHDKRYTFGTAYSMLKPILPHNVKYIDKPTTLLRGDAVLHILPFNPSIDTMKTQINEFQLKHDKINLLFSHFSIGGAKITDDYSIGKKYGYINSSDLKMYDYCFLGDIHKSQEIDDFIFYPGSPVQHSFGEENDLKATWRIRISNSAVVKERIISDAPCFKTFYIEKDEDIQQLSMIDGSLYPRVLSKIPLGNKVDTTKFVYIESPKDVQLDISLDYKEVVINYVKERNPELLSLLCTLL
jgi:DNA repair exonuclease SbcCD nuclease subunit